MTTIKLKELGIELDEETLLERAAEIIARNAMSDYSGYSGRGRLDVEAGEDPIAGRVGNRILPQST